MRYLFTVVLILAMATAATATTPGAKTMYIWNAASYEWDIQKNLSKMTPLTEAGYSINHTNGSWQIAQDDEHHRVDQRPGGGALRSGGLLEELEPDAALASCNADGYRTPTTSSVRLPASAEAA